MKMNSQTFQTIVISLFLCSLMACSSLSKSPRYELQKFSEYTMENGLRVILIPDASLPLISYSLLLPSGSTEDPKEKSGLSNLVAASIDQGTKGRSAFQVAEDLAQIGGSFSASVADDYTLLSSSSLSLHKDKLLEIYSDILMKPSFPKREVEKQRSRILVSLKGVVDQPGSFASNGFQGMIFGDHPYGTTDLETRRALKKIPRKEVIRKYLRTYSPNQAILSVVGQFDRAEIKSQLQKTFGGWKPQKISQAQLPPQKIQEGLKIKFLSKDDLKQSQIRIGHLGIDRAHPDFIALRVANTILGGAFASRLMTEIRTKRGLTYSISSRFDAKKQRGGFQVSTFTRHEKIFETVTQIQRLLQEFADKGVTSSELSDAKAYLRGVFPRSLETPEALAFNLKLLRFWGIGDSYLTDYLKNLEALSVSDVNTAIKKAIQPQNLKILVFGPSKFSKPLEKIGPVELTGYKQLL